MKTTVKNLKNLRECLDCRMAISVSATACPQCGARLTPKTKASTWVIGGLFALAVFALVFGGGEKVACPPLKPINFGLPDDKQEAFSDFLAKAERLRASGVCPVEGSFGPNTKKFYIAVFDVETPSKLYFVRLTREQLGR